MKFDEEDAMLEDMGLFNAAVHARHVDIQRPEVQVIVAALDGSNQDATVRALAAALSKRTRAVVHEHAGAQTAADILRVAAERQAGLIVAPVPFGRDMSVLKDESLGSVVDMLLQEASCPVLCVRELLDEGGVQAALAEIVTPLTLADDASVRAVSWSLRLLDEGGRLTMLAIADSAAIEEVRQLLGGVIDTEVLQPDALGRAVSQELAGLIGAAQKRGEAEGRAVHVDVKVGRAVDLVVGEANRERRLIVVGASKDHQTTAYHRATDIILEARSSVLVV